MSIEQQLAQLIAAINCNTEALKAFTGAPAAAPAPAPVESPVVQTPPVSAASVTMTSPFPQAAPSPVAPPAPPAPPPVPAGCPFATAGELQAWAFQKYQANPHLQKAIEGVITSHGLSQMDHATPEQMVTLYQQINAL